ncbi:hypothetical protein BTA51_02360 [Hahella sp. CCB-MM4]|uniref:MBL fold metallo-hydrolase n=1 Tax=Hahella sp. (strain CCB-MM4) TaxID=1926491 RepID=UPI000BD21318|nr:MBL fold metallo-hydrolase [Hahella sp. CCB-MM4]OZG75247.1 hypothetical protein BTA51_02360 [Hahella sp. CCB-MM4]
MQLEIVGSGEAYDRFRVNASVLVEDQEYCLLIDCGPTVPQALWRRQLPSDAVDAIYLTHIHPDHASGITALLNQWASAGRCKDLEIICQPDQQSHLRWMADYAAWPERLPFSIGWHDATQLTELGPWLMRTAQTRHSITNLAVRLDQKPRASGMRGALFYSGDGRPTMESAQLMTGSVLAMQECFAHQDQGESSHHGDLPECLRYQRLAEPHQLLLYHIQDGLHGVISEAVQHRTGVAVAQDGERWCCISGKRLDLKEESYAAG